MGPSFAPCNLNVGHGRRACDRQERIRHDSFLVRRGDSAGRGKHRPQKNKLQLQKLLYLVDAASVALWNRPAFREPVIALPHGPALSAVTNENTNIADPNTHIIEHIPAGDPALNAEDQATVAWVLERFGDWSENRLINFVKRTGNPWKQVLDARGPGPNSVIPLEDTVLWFKSVGLDPRSGRDHAASLRTAADKIASAHSVALEKLGQ